MKPTAGRFSSREIARIFNVPPWLIDGTIPVPWWHRISVPVYWIRGVVQRIRSDRRSRVD